MSTTPTPSLPASRRLSPRLAAALLAAAALLLALAPRPAPAQPADGAALLASPLRTDADRKADAGRKPLDLLRFSQVEPGMKVLDIASEGGYTAQLMALAVGAQGHVWAQNDEVNKNFASRLAAHPQANLEALIAPSEDPYPAALPRVDLITFVLSYHDIVNEPVDRAKMNRALFNALRPGGHLIVLDHAAREGHGLQDTKTLHRIEEATLRAEVEAAGFKLEAEGAFLRNPDDPREQPFFKMRPVPTDRFALRFVKPR